MNLHNLIELVIDRGFESDSNGATYVRDSSIHVTMRLEKGPNGRKWIILTHNNKGIEIESTFSESAAVLWERFSEFCTEEQVSSRDRLIGGMIDELS